MNKLQKIKQFEEENNNLILKKVESQLDRILEGQEVNQQELRLGFIGLAKQNSELLDLNRDLSHQLEIVVSELNAIKKEREDVEKNGPIENAFQNVIRLILKFTII